MPILDAETYRAISELENEYGKQRRAASFRKWLYHQKDGPDLVKILDEYGKAKRKKPTAGVALIYENAIAVVRHQGRPACGVVYGMPKGHKEEGESEIQTALRELLEETGYRVEPDNQLVRMSIPGKCVFFYCKIKGDLPILSPQRPGEIAEALFVPFATIRKSPAIFSQQVRAVVSALTTSNRQQRHPSA